MYPYCHQVMTQTHRSSHTRVLQKCRIFESFQVQVNGPRNSNSIALGKCIYRESAVSNEPASG